MLTRIPPFTASNEMDLLIKVRDAKYRPVGELTPGLPVELEQITDKCLTRSRANRYQTAAEAEGDLRAFLRKFMPNYSRSHLGRFIRKMFATEIERELRMLEEYVLTDEMSDDVGENLLGRDENFEPPDVPFQPKPTSVSIVAAGSTDFSSDSNFTTMPKVGRHEDIHSQNTLILDGRGRNAPQPHPPERKARAQPPPPPRSAPQPSARPIYEDDVHSAPTMIIDIGRTRGRRG
jgi:serine/threonine-protein kinase